MKEKVTFENNRGFRLTAYIAGLKKGIIQPVVIFAHGLNSSKDSPRNLFIADGLVEKGSAVSFLTLLDMEKAREELLMSLLSNLFRIWVRHSTISTK